MNLDPIAAILGFITLVVVPSVLLYWYFVKNSKLPEENGLTPVHTEVGGGRFDGINYTWPFVRIAIYDQFMVISYSHKILLRQKDITNVELEKHILSMGVRISHNRSEIPSLVILWSTNAQVLLEMIKQMLQKQSISS